MLKYCQETKKLADESSKFNDSVNGVEIDQILESNGLIWDRHAEASDRVLRGG